MAGFDYLAQAECLIEEAPQYKDGPEYLPEMIQLGIAQQLRRIADILEREAADRWARETYA